MKNLIIIISLLILSVLSVQAESFKIGFSVPLTGDLQEYGFAVQHGIEMAAAELKKKDSNFDLQYAFDDNAYSASKAVTSYQRLKNITGADLIYMWGETPLSSIAQISQRDKFPIIAMAIDTTYSQGKDYIIRTINPPGDFAKKTLSEIKIKDAKISIIKTEDAFLNAYANALTNANESITVNSVSPDIKDFRSIIAKMKTSKPDVLGVFMLPGQVSSFYRQMKELDLQISTFGTDIFDSKNEVRDSNGTMDGAFFVNIGVDPAFKVEYEKEKNLTQIAYAYNAYTVMLSLGEKFKGAENKSLGTTEIIQRLKNNKDGSYIYKEDPSGDKYYQFPLIIKRITNGEIVE